MFKSGFVTIVGRPNVGKSTLLNLLMGEKLSIVSNKPQTTRNNIQTILTGDNYQIVFVDTPGIHKPKHKLGEYMVDSAKNSIKDVDLVLFLTTPDVEVGRGDKFIIEQLQYLFFCHYHSPILNRTEIHQGILQHCKKSFDFSDKFC